MNIDKMSDQEKSVLLANAMDWRIEHKNKTAYIVDGSGKPVEGMTTDHIIIPDHRRVYWRDYVLDFYDPDDMALAWRVMNWAYSQTNTEEEQRNQEWLDKIDLILQDYWCEPPAKAQRAWLDKILELAIEAGLVEVDK